MRIERSFTSLLFGMDAVNKMTVLLKICCLDSVSLSCASSGGWSYLLYFDERRFAL